ncbi:LysR substrate-binding domain-containing protein [Sphingomonas alba]|uniref:LysR substrate-binding domain-containing protein n=1 Tax=Sphingomonas alba TaxID=2908208 RepID=A0ABT0RNR6_9SPHN|nr:LysR substrate-binding domain-containing protein [Sphingomonas alba]MCL6684235.1 LysR substrate-binding domain-containing protein [Sphingomonas alba]
MRKLPPLSAIRVFEAAARHEHFTAAAEELGMTQAAVSYQIRALEDRVGARLFERSKGRVRLTDIGRRLLRPLTDAFDRMDAAFAAVRADDENMLSISTTSTFANTWLAWRIGGFQMEHPNLAVRLDASNSLIDFATTEFDVAIRAGEGEWPGLHATRLFEIDYTPICSPRFMEEWQNEHGDRDMEPHDLVGLPRVSANDPWLDQWLTERGVEVPDRPPQPGVQLDSQTAEGTAAMAGRGIAMLTPFFWRYDLTEGRLVRPFRETSSRGWGYWFVCPEHRRQSPKIKRFCEWLLPTARGDHEAARTAGLDI